VANKVTLPPATTPRKPLLLVRAWWHVRGFLRSRSEVARQHAENEKNAFTVAATLAAASERARVAETVNSSLEEGLNEREREIFRLKREKAEIEATLAVRVREIEELTLWLEKVRTRVNADIASEVAREQRSLNPAARAAPRE
jgi:septal ring factor EnvC (AmiA/AmiB activator)